MKKGIVVSKLANLNLKVLGITSLIAIIFLACFVMATIVITPAAPVNNSNFSTSITLISLTTNDVTNCTFAILNNSGTQIAASKLGTDVATTHVNASVSIASLGNGLYNLSINCTNSSNLSDSSVTRMIFTKDSTIPVLNLTSIFTNQNFSYKNLGINVTIVETNFSYANITIFNSTGSLINSTINNSVAFNIPLSVMVDGLYSVNVTAYDYAGNSNSTAANNVRVDTTAPVFSAFVSPISANNFTNSNGVIPLNISLTDAGVGVVSYVLFNITNSSGAQNLTINSSFGTNIVGNYAFNMTGFNVSNWADGLYRIKITAKDNLSNTVTNLEIGNITLDKTVPSQVDFALISATQSAIIFNITLLDALSGINGTCVVDRFAAIVSGSELLQNVSEGSLACGNSYTYYLNCSDNAGNINFTNVTYSTLACNVTTSSSSSGSYALTSELTGGLTKTLYIGSVIGFNILGGKHSLLITAIKDNKVTIKLSSVPQYATLAAGEEKKFDLNADNVNDILVKINSILSSTKAEISIRAISEAITGEVINPTTPAGEEKETPATKVTEVLKSQSSSLWLIILGILIVILVIYYIIKSKK